MIVLLANAWQGLRPNVSTGLTRDFRFPSPKRNNTRVKIGPRPAVSKYYMSFAQEIIVYNVACTLLELSSSFTNEGFLFFFFLF